MQSTAYSKVRAITRVGTPTNEAELLELALAGSAANLERVVRGWRTLDRADEAKMERLRHRTRRFSVFPAEDGMYVVRGRLTPEVGAVLMRAVEAANDALFRESGRKDEDIPAPEPRQLRADAVGLLAERALAAGFGTVGGSGGGDDDSETGPPVSGSRAERYQVVLHVDMDTLAEAPADFGQLGLSELDDGTRVSAETARRLSCDAARVVVLEDRAHPEDRADCADCSDRAEGEHGTHVQGSILDVGRRTRTVPPALRRALEARDRGCRFPGCGLRFTDAHHIVHWADGGETSLANTMLLCRRHHRRVHEGGWTVCSDRDGRAVVFFTPQGRALFDAPPPPALEPDPVGALVQGNRERGVVPDWRSGMPRWRRDADIPWDLEAAAREALDPWEEEDDAEADNAQDDDADEDDAEEATTRRGTTRGSG